MMKTNWNFNFWTQWFGSFSGIAGALLLAMNTKSSPYGWVFFLASNLAWIAFALRTKVKSILLMQLVFLATSVLGAVRWLI
jgi:nicotinamide riboside transporter PnuC